MTDLEDYTVTALELDEVAQLMGYLTELEQDEFEQAQDCATAWEK